VASSEPSPRSDARLVALAAAGDREAFAAIYHRYHRPVYRFARLMTGSAGLAEDVTQEVFVALMRDLARYEPLRARLSTYLYGVARNVTRSRLRRERRFVGLDAVGSRVPEPSTETDVVGELSDAQNLDRLRRVIRTLPSRYREVVILCELHGLSYADAAAAIGRPVGTVRSRLHRARHLIAERLDAGARGLTASSTRKVARCLA
jgi:RNA polymerase sigma-70 factor (ECF subfamily)